jgi:hypothetical protein
MGYRVLLVGSGGREHALAWKLLQSPLCDHLVVAPGNPGIEALGRGVGKDRIVLAEVGADATDNLVALAQAENVDLVVCGPEVPLMAGLGDACRAVGLRFFGPSRAAAEIEGSKKFAKDLMSKAGIPTAAYGSFRRRGVRRHFHRRAARQRGGEGRRPVRWQGRGRGLVEGRGQAGCALDAGRQGLRRRWRARRDRGAAYRPRSFDDGSVRRHALRAAGLGRGPQGRLRRRSWPQHRGHGRVLAVAARRAMP